MAIGREELLLILKLKDEATRGLRQIHNRLRNFGRSILSITKRAAIGLGVLGGAITGLVAFTGIGFNAMREQAEVAFSVLLGSAEAAQKRMTELIQFARTTPFQLGGVVEASRILETFTGAALSTGEGLRLVGDIAAGTTRPFQEVALWVGRLFDSLKAQRPIGEAAARLQEMGAISGEARARLEALAKSGQNITEIWPQVQGEFARFNGMMQRQSNTFLGLWSTIKDTFAQVSGQVMEPFFERIRSGMAKIVQATSTEEFQRRVDQLAKSVDRFAAAVGKSFREDIIPALQALAQWFRDNRADIEDALAAIANAVAIFASRFRTGLEVVTPLVQDFFGFIINNKAAMVAAIIAVGLAISTALGPVSLAFLAIGAIIAIIGQFKDDWRVVANFVIDVLENLIVGFFSFRKKVITVFVDIIEKGLNFLLDKLADFLSALGGISLFGKDLIPGADAAAAAVRKVADNVENLSDIATALDDAALRGVDLLFGALRGRIGTSAAEGIVGGVSGTGGSDAIGQLLEELERASHDTAEVLSPAGGGGLAGSGGGAAAALDDVEEAAQGASDAVKKQIEAMLRHAEMMNEFSKTLPGALAAAGPLLAPMGREKELIEVGALQSVVRGGGTLSSDQLSRLFELGESLGIEGGLDALVPSTIIVQIGDEELTNVWVRGQQGAIREGRE